MREPTEVSECGWDGPAVTLTEPQDLRSAAVFSSPHSGRRYPEKFKASSRLDPLALRSSEDAYVDHLFAAAPEFGAPLIAAEFPRAFLDANRCEDELDPALIARLSPRKTRTLRVSAGLGVVPRIVAEGMPIYRGKLRLADVQSRIELCHRPYHAAVNAALQRARSAFGTALLIDCHSMPSERSRFAMRRSEIVLGDCYGAAADTDISDAVFVAFQRAGFRVARNVPFAGGYITQRYGSPKDGVNAVQIEIDRGLYLDQKRIVQSAAFKDVKAALQPAISEICALPTQSAALLAAE